MAALAASSSLIFCLALHQITTDTGHDKITIIEVCKCRVKTTVIHQPFSTKIDNMQNTV